MKIPMSVRSTANSKATQSKVPGCATLRRMPQTLTMAAAVRNVVAAARNRFTVSMAAV